MPSLFDSFDLGPVHLTSRIVMPPMTRTRTSEGALPTDGDLPNELTVKYYGQRASAGLINSEVNDVDQSSHGYARIPGIHSEAQKQAWRPVTEEVHRQGGTIFMQLWHVGRLAHSSLLPNGQAPVGVTAEQAVGSEVFAHGPDGRLRFMAAETPRPLSTEEVTAMVGTFAKAAANAREVGFDGIEIHAANGYLIEQFMNSVLNTRTDRYGGGSMEDRARFLMEVVDAVVAEFGAGRVGVRLSPFGKYGSCPLIRSSRRRSCTSSSSSGAVAWPMSICSANCCPTATWNRPRSRRAISTTTCSPRRERRSPARSSGAAASMTSSAPRQRSIPGWWT
ncbi:MULTISPECIES: alkene reductase [unclassified Mesorhizobium]|uniref:oxidoreductase n=1 Tax=unclassified Mesorhizobium TaxID=325217 RepID=UPI001CD160B2|nr:MULTISPECIES: alkene reductase [unclassified Mesorhizobium]MCA0055479.1 alkene reductase [Mesorhizobium sp. B261B1A]